MNTQGKKILIIDDSKDLREVLANALHSENLAVLQAEDGEDGLKIALAEHPDLILLDIVMLKMDGITMLQKLRKDEWGRNAQVMILTNLMDAEKIDSAMSEGVYDFLVKSNWSLPDLVQKIKVKLGSGNQEDIK